MSRLTSRFRLAALGLARHRRATLVMVATLAILIAVLCALASLGYNLLVSPWTYDSDRLGVLRHGVAGSTPERYGFTAGEYRLIRDAGLFDTVVASQRVPVAFGDGSGPAQPRILVRTTPGALQITGVQSLLGRFVQEREAGSERRLVISHEIWQNRFDASPDVLGRTLQLDGAAHEIVGVMPPRFHFMGGDFWAAHATDPASDDSPEARLVLNVALPAGLRVDQLGPHLEALAGRLVQHAPPGRYPRGWSISALRVIDAVTGPQRPAVILVLAGAGLLLLLGVLNVSILLVARQIADAATLATRRALGESRLHTVTVAFVESLLIAVAAVAVALPLGRLMFERFVGLVALEWVPRELEGAFEFSTPALWTLPLLALLLATVLTLLRLPGLARAEARAATANASRAGVRRREIAALRWLSGVQIALAGAILVAALAIASGARSLLSQDLGIDLDATQHASLSFPRADVPDGVARLAAMDAVADHLRRQGAAAVGFTGAAPMQRYSRSGIVSEAPGLALDEPLSVDVHAVHGDLAAALGLRLREGRMLDPALDHERAEAVVVVTRALAERLAPGRSALGLSLRVGAAGEEAELRRIVGVVDDVRHESPLSMPRPTLYVPYAQDAASMRGAGGQVALLVRWRAAGEPAAVPTLARISAAVTDVNPWIAVGEVTTMLSRAERSIAGVTLARQLFAGFALLGLLLASLGIAAVAELGVARQRHGMAVRAALGASPRRLMGEVLGTSLRLAVPAATAGCLLAWLLDDLLAGAVQGQADVAAGQVIGTAAILLACALLAALLPARRAMKVQPLAALRDG